jgi:hypothetical protein
MVAAFALEIARVTASSFKRDQEKWAAHDKGLLLDETCDQSTASEETPTRGFGVQQVDGSIVSKC